ncbi:hypothetical protein Pla52o_54050 [Novipirellula galeiformis]|uniref:SGNH hydrolase-type esterase domain-containing protein n=1 Tax=Novipirellula galeiformis TaxID=2528004 RepID=A0A5C6BY15_9BACT|nr:SGNH/GDSL hydrolase family protein [Novipirellula galeiformis]TWU17230.1 hypothetical protein Pla52o_54050 [Novipirellula galeiformis]
MNHARSKLNRIVARILGFGIILACLGTPGIAHAEHEGKLQILLLGDSTTKGTTTRRLKPEGPHLEQVIEQLLAAEEDLPACHVINSSMGSESIRRLLDSGRYDRDASKLPGLDYVFIRYGLNDRVLTENFAQDFPKHFAELCERLRRDHPGAELIPMTVIPFESAEVSEGINQLIRQAAAAENLEVFDIYPRYAAEVRNDKNALQYRHYPLAKIPARYHELVKPFVHGASVEVMDNELDSILGQLPGWYSERHPNLAGYNVIADETAKFLAKRLRKKQAERVSVDQ